MIPEPSSFASGSSHRVALFPQPTSDFEKLEDMLADAIGAARDAVQHAPMLDYECFKPLQTWMADIEKCIDQGRLLSPDFRRPCDAALSSLRKNQPSADAASAHEHMTNGLATALQLSYRVSDLLAAERDIGWHRGVGRQ
ncbi:MAG: hypothetical protein KDK10_00395 [Maritimibacter sp.]|nr:hypothetical protein [Maritimibacter sp.]